MLNSDQIIQKLSAANRAEVQRATGLSYMYLSRLVWGVIKNPGSRQIDTLREYFERHETSRPQ